MGRPLRLVSYSFAPTIYSGRDGSMCKLMKMHRFRRVKDAAPYEYTICSYVLLCKALTVWADPMAAI